MDQLERHIRKNRNSLDNVEQPDIEKMWSAIQQEVVPEKRKKSALIIGLRKVAVAASFMLIGGIAVWLFMNPSNNNKASGLAAFYPELAETEIKYQRTISEKEAAIPFDSLDRFLFEEILDELNELEDIKATTLEDLPQYSDNERVVNVLLRYYERKIQILERLSNEYQKSKRNEKKREIHI